ncbi:MAG: tripartite tricarboxylate transporter substrate binding protein [Betaproteobacteria bacterium]|nr:tripartite tricarboxylate transporter substrate binding protein [Betaproteobacteria bacterium]
MNKFMSYMVACGVILPASAITAAAEFPEKPIRIVTPGSPGAGTDILARQIGQKLTESWGQPVAIENRMGGGGGIAGRLVLNSEPSGHTLLLAAGSNMTVNPTLYKLDYNPVQDFVAITEIAASPYLIIVHPSVPAKTVPQLIALAKQKKGSFNYASSSVGSPDHLAGELFKLMAGVDITHIPYKGGALAIIDVRGGYVPIGFSTVPTALPHVKSQGVRVLAITDSKRSKLFPDIPTVAETLPGYELLSWNGIWAPAATPPTAVDKIYREVRRIISLPEINARLRNDGFQPVGSSPTEFTEFMKTETSKFTKIIKAANIHVN